MSNYQSLSIIGRSGKDGELRTTQGGKQVCSFTVAVNNYDKTVTWYDCSVFGKQAENYAAKFLKKGSAVHVVGTPSLNLYQKKDGTHGASIQIMVKDMNIINEGGGESKYAEPAEAVQNTGTHADALTDHQKAQAIDVPFQQQDDMEDIIPF